MLSIIPSFQPTSGAPPSGAARDDSEHDHDDDDDDDIGALCFKLFSISCQINVDMA